MSKEKEMARTPEEFEQMISKLEAIGKPEAAELARMADRVTEAMRPLIGNTAMLVVLKSGEPKSAFAISFNLKDESGKMMPTDQGMRGAIHMAREAADAFGERVHQGAFSEEVRNRIYTDAIEACRWAREEEAKTEPKPCPCGKCKIEAALGLIIGGSKLLEELKVPRADLMQLVHLAKELGRIAEVEVVRASAIGTA